MDASDEPPLRKGRGKVRDETLRETILAAAAAVLFEKGFKHFTMEGVAARAQASKVTLYKWWPSKGALALDGCVRAISGIIGFPQTDSPRADIETQLTQVIRTLTTTEVGKAIVELIGAAQSDPILKRELSVRYIQPRREIAGPAFARLLNWDPIEKKAALYAVTDQVYGAIYNRLLFGLGPLDENFARELVEFWVTPSLRAPSS